VPRIIREDQRFEHADENKAPEVEE
jgi:hypothetical protein